MKLNTPEILDTLIWMFPPIIILFLYPILRIILEDFKNSLLKIRKNCLIFFCFLAIIGFYCLILSQKNISKNIENDNKIIFYAILGFISLDVGNEMLSVI